ncbi:TetR family transcriptional regulator [Palleronia aestuarii]|uniref:TetR family transcriptional regulator n=1 Tax=Palleronia aestuarii TaxID=568105 RepID=A0A2W7N366_9RHOB|nr:TetR/AcrR family transcriptional regulator [Palleronia aestuarii]PZX11254.1 TetR family transcriptional regulator [Palleronia aestuarii]
MKDQTTENPEVGTGRRQRVDARRNVESVLRAAMVVFARSGVDAPVREIADEAGVGIGTLYRHFPKRSDLIAAAFRAEVDACADAAWSLAAQHDSGDALSKWVCRYVEFIIAKMGLATALHSGDPAYDDLHEYFETHLCPALQMLLDAAVETGEAQSGLAPKDLLFAIARLCACNGDDPSRSRRMIGLLLDGVRCQAPRPR